MKNAIANTINTIAVGRSDGYRLIRSAQYASDGATIVTAAIRPGCSPTRIAAGVRASRNFFFLFDPSCRMHLMTEIVNKKKKKKNCRILVSPRLARSAWNVISRRTIRLTFSRSYGSCRPAKIKPSSRCFSLRLHAFHSVELRSRLTILSRSACNTFAEDAITDLNIPGGTVSGGAHSIRNHSFQGADGAVTGDE